MGYVHTHLFSTWLVALVNKGFNSQIHIRNGKLVLTLFCLGGGAESARADFKSIVLKENSSNHSQT